MARASASAVERLLRGVESRSMPPMASFSATNSSAVMLPASSAPRPYCTPTLSRVSRAAGLPGTLPQMDSAQDHALQRGRFAVAAGFAGSYTALLGNSQLFVAEKVVIAPVVWLVTCRAVYTPALP